MKESMKEGTHAVAGREVIICKGNNETGPCTTMFLDGVRIYTKQDVGKGRYCLESFFRGEKRTTKRFLFDGEPTLISVLKSLTAEDRSAPLNQKRIGELLECVETEGVKKVYRSFLEKYFLNSGKHFATLSRKAVGRTKEVCHHSY